MVLEVPGWQVVIDFGWSHLGASCRTGGRVPVAVYSAVVDVFRTRLLDEPAAVLVVQERG